jgi:hypothetical protein
MCGRQKATLTRLYLSNTDSPVTLERELSINLSKEITSLKLRVNSNLQLKKEEAAVHTRSRGPGALRGHWVAGQSAGR